MRSLVLAIASSYRVGAHLPALAVALALKSAPPEATLAVALASAMHMSRTPAIQPQHGARPLGKIEILPNAIHTIAVQAISECYGVVGITAPRLRNGQPVMLEQGHLNQGVQLRIVNDQIILEVYVALEYGLRISEIAHNIMSSVKFSIEKMLGVPVAQVNVNVQGLSHSGSTK